MLSNLLFICSIFLFFVSFFFQNCTLVLLACYTYHLLKRQHNIFLVDTFIRDDDLTKFNPSDCLNNNIIVKLWILISWVEIIYFTRLFKADTNNIYHSMITSVFEVL